MIRRLAALACLAAILAPSAAAAAPADAATTQRDAQRAAVALARKAAVLQALGAISFPPLQAALQGLPLGTATTRADLATQLAADDAAAATALTALQHDGATLAPEVAQSLSTLSSNDITAARSGHPISSDGGGYLAALDDLLSRSGAPDASGSRPQPPAITRALGAALQQQPAAGSDTAPATGHSGGHTVVIAVVVVAVALLLGAIGYAMRPGRRRRTSIQTPLPWIAQQQQHHQQQASNMHAVLEASRRLTAGTVGGDINRAIVRELLAVVPARAAALVARQGDRLVVAHETQPGLLVPDGFAGGVVERAANTGRVLAELVSGDPSFTRQPAQVLLAPLVGNGRVEAVLVVTRDPVETFTTAEREALASLAPVAAAALHSAARTQAAVDASFIDPLTGVGNRRQLDAKLPEVLADGGPTGFCMVDLDHFKAVNDTHGHPAGDTLLRGVCGVIRDTVRPTDGVYRYGGEEFCIVLPHTELAAARETAERVRAAIETASFDIGSGQRLSATASMGVATTTDRDAAALIARADAALYDAKHAGRNRVCVAG